jgi:hypothetical protein
MHETLLHYIWKNSLHSQREYLACTGERIEILDPGKHNSDGGPDFTDARIRINDTTWAGNVEIHVRSSEWEIHKHHVDAAYNNVILHAVYENDRPCFTATGRRIPGISLQIGASLEHNYAELINNRNLIRCREKLHRVDSQLISLWMSTLSIERLQAKIQGINDILKSVNNNWEEAFYIHLARSFGLKINALPFELLAKSTPLKIISKHCRNLEQTEALLFGQAGLLDVPGTDEYTRTLQKEYLYLQKIYQLNSIPPGIWKFLRLRPANFPTLRIAQFASLIYHAKWLFSVTMMADSICKLISLYACSASNYWKSHHTFGKRTSKEISGTPGKNTRLLLIVNTVIPFMFAFGQYKCDESLKNKALQLLEETPAETNRIIKKWAEAGIVCRHAADSQALLHLSTSYCETGDCLKCRIGNQILTLQRQEAG